MESTLMYELLAAERGAQYRRETERDRLSLLAASDSRPAARAEGVRRGRRAVAAAVLGVVGLSALRPRKGAR
jgi:hypothetical protein